MKKVRITPQSLNDPLTILNVQRIIFIAVFAGTAYLGNHWRWDGALAFLVISSAIVQSLNRIDPDWLQILPACFRFQLDRAYDPCEREYFELIITEDSGNDKED